MVNRERLLNTFLSLLEIDSESGSERDFAAAVVSRLQSLGLRPLIDAAGNVMAAMTGPGGPYLVSAHVDTVMSTRGLRVLVQEGIVKSDGLTILGADDKVGVAAILETVQCLLEREIEHPALEIVFTVGEERGLLGSKALDFSQISARQGICLDSSGAVGTIITQGPSQVDVDATILGRAAHAGLAPELGISAILVASEAISRMPLGRIDDETTANVGIIRGGAARNIVPEKVEVTAEARSRDEGRMQVQAAHMVAAFREAAARHGAQADVTVTEAYRAFNLSPDEPIVHRVMSAALSLGIEPSLEATGGGSDANVFNQHGIMTVNLGVGYENAHSPTERIAIDDLVRAADLLLAVLHSPSPRT